VTHGPSIDTKIDDLELHKFEFLVNFSGFRRFRTQRQLGRYCQRQRC